MGCGFWKFEIIKVLELLINVNYDIKLFDFRSM